MQNSGCARNVSGDFMWFHLKLVTEQSVLFQAQRLFSEYYHSDLIIPFRIQFMEASNMVLVICHSVDAVAEVSVCASIDNIWWNSAVHLLRGAPERKTGQPSEP